MPSKSLILSYVFDWIVIIAIAAAAGGLNSVTPAKRPFSLLDLDISFPYIPESISTATLIVVSLIAPAVIILLVVALFVPGFATNRNLSRSQILQRKLWEWEQGWAGLALSMATAFFATQALKNMFGKPRPDLLARCNPDLSNIAAHVVGGYGQDISARWTLVNSSICQNTNMKVMNDGFRSFPSGHSSFSFSGLLYLSFFLASKFAVQIPHLPAMPSSHDASLTKSRETPLLPVQQHGEEEGIKDDAGRNEPVHATFARAMPTRNQAASPPNYLLVIALIPVCVAFYITSTRYAQYYHHGFDVISGSLIGIISAYGSFRWYHTPLSRGSGWAWGPRSRDRAWGVGVGIENYVGTEGWESAKKRRNSDVETGPA